MMPYVDMEAARLALHLAETKQISSSALSVALGLASFVQTRTRVAVIDASHLADRINASRWTVYRATEELEKAGFATVKKTKGHLTIYTIHAPPQVADCNLTQNAQVADCYLASSKLPTGKLQIATCAVADCNTLQITDNNKDEADSGKSTEPEKNDAPPRKPPRKQNKEADRIKSLIEYHGEIHKPLLKLYGEIVKPPHIDKYRSGAKKWILELVNDGYKIEDLTAAVRNYEKAQRIIDDKKGITRDEGLQFRKSSGNFFSKETMYFDQFLPENMDEPKPIDGWTDEQKEQTKRSYRNWIETRKAQGIDYQDLIQEYRETFDEDINLD